MTDLQTKSLCLAVSFSRWGTSRKVDITPDAETQADKTMLGVTKRLLEAPEVKAISAIDGDLKRWLSTRCVPFPLQRAVYLVPVPLLSAVQAQIEDVVRRRAAAVDALAEAMPRLRSEAKLRLIDLYDESQYPTGDDLRAKYDLRHAYVSFDVPGMLKDLDQSLFGREKEKAQERWKEASEEIRYAMREAFAELVGRLSERLTDGLDGKRKVFRDSAIGNLQEFIDSFAGRNLTDDAELAQAVDDARRIVAGTDPKQLRKSDTVRARVGAEMAKVTAALDTMITARPSRRISMEEE